MDPETRQITYGAARAHAYEHYLSAILAGHARDDLIALAAFYGDIKSIVWRVSEPHLGEIRLQWWRDWLNQLAVSGKGCVTGNPLADSFGEVVMTYNLPRQAITCAIDAAGRDLYSDPVVTWDEVLSTCDDLEGVCFGLAARIIGMHSTGDCLEAETGVRGAGMRADDEICVDAGRAYGLSKLLLRLGALAARGRWPLPQRDGSVPVVAEALADPEVRRAAHSGAVKLAQLARSDLMKVRENWASTPRATQQAILPVALVEPYLKAFERAGQQAYSSPVEISPLACVWRLWRANVFRRV